MVDADRTYLRKRGMSFEREGDLNHTVFLSRLAAKTQPPEKLSYVILVPTLRCDLACSYCQVSRVAEKSKGFDWSEEITSQVLKFLDLNCGDNIQVEFQGGEPTLRCDIIKEVIEFCRARFKTCLFVICTNLSRLSKEIKEIATAEDVLISTSLDGAKHIHKKQRTLDSENTDNFFENLKVMSDVTNGRVSALPTLDPNDLPLPSEILDTFEEYGMYSIFIRPIFYHGFARKQHPESQKINENWQAYYKRFISEVIERNNSRSENFFEEYYLKLALRKLTHVTENSHVDLRSPNWLGYDHMLIDYNGLFYPTDEARMLARSGQINLSIGDVTNGIDETKREGIQGRAINALDSWCSQCVYQPACGSDPIDDLARYGRADVPRPATAFCQKNMSIFDLAMRLLLSKDPKVKNSVSHWLDLPSAFSISDYRHD